MRAEGIEGPREVNEERETEERKRKEGGVEGQRSSTIRGRSKNCLCIPGIIRVTINFALRVLSIILALPAFIRPARISRVLVIAAFTLSRSLFSSSSSLFISFSFRKRIPDTADRSREIASRRERPRGRLSKKFIVGKLQCFDNFLPCRGAVSDAPRLRAPGHDCGRKEHALTQILRRLKQRSKLFESGCA